MLTRSGYNVLACLALICGTALSVASIVAGQDPESTIAVSAPAFTVAVGLAGRGA